MAPILREVLNDAARRLAPVTETPRLDAEILLAHAVGLSRAGLLARLEEARDAQGFAPLLERRLAHEPIAYILGDWEFYSLSFATPAPLLVPRPETEHLVEAVLEFVEAGPARVLEIGCGTGCVAVSIAHNAPRVETAASDVNPVALRTTAHNASRHGVRPRIHLFGGALFEALCAQPAFDVVCSNPPYVEDAAWSSLPPVIRLYEDPGALLAGPDGLDVIRPLVQQARHYLKPGGLLAFEVGMGQYETVSELLARAGYTRIRFRRDLAGVARIALAHAP